MDKNENIFKDIEKPLNSGKKLLWIGIPLTLISPFLLMKLLNVADFKDTGTIGDTIGGITAPVINIFGAILVFLALKAQIVANVIVQKQINSQIEEKRLESESSQLNKLYENFKSSIDNFTYSTLDTWEFRNEENYELRGSEAFYQLFQDFYCNAHMDDESLKTNPKITEILSVLEICNTLLEKIQKSEIVDKEVLNLLTMHQFIYRIFPKLSEEYPNNLKLHYCNSCKKDHGLPNRIVELIINIKSKCKEDFC